MSYVIVLRVSALLLLTSAAAAQRRVWIVDLAGGAGVDFTLIDPAVAAASDGDRIEVRGPGRYPRFVLNKALDVEAVNSALVVSCEVTAIASGRSARLAGFRLQLDLNSTQNRRPLWVHDCAGSVLLASIQSASSGPGLAAENCASVLAVDCDLRGSAFSTEFSIVGAAGIHARSAPVAVHRSVVQGGPGRGFFASMSISPTIGLPGCDTNSSLVLVACTVRGGTGGYGGRNTTMCVPGQPGGAGILASGPCVAMDRSVLAGGAGGSDFGGCGAGSQGVSVIGSPVSPAAITPDCTLSGGPAVNVRAMVGLTTTLPRSANLGQPVTTVVRGPQGALMVLLMDLDHAHAILGFTDMPLLLRPAALFPIAAGTLDGSGVFTLVTPVPLDPALRNEFVFQQAVAVTLAGGVLLGSLADLRLR